MRIGSAAALALLFCGHMQLARLIVRLQRDKQNISVEIIHKPSADTRWIYVSGNSPEFTTGSLIQSEGEQCAVIHRLTWRNVPKVGILEVDVAVRDANNKVLDSATRKMILGPEGEQ